MFRRLRFKLWFWLFKRALRGAQHALHQGGSGTCGNRSWTSLDIGGKLEVTVTYRDKRRPDAYSREELVTMLWQVRKHEAIQRWPVPEPSKEWVARRGRDG